MTKASLGCIIIRIKTFYARTEYMIEDVLTYLRKNLKIAVKNVFANFSQYACFFAALFIIQIFLGTLTVILFNNDSVEWDHVQEEYDYHLMVHGLNDYQMLLIENNALAVFSNDFVFDIVRVIEHESTFDGTVDYDLYIMLHGDTDEEIEFSLDRFVSKYLKELSKHCEEGEKITYTKTPLLNFDRNLLVNRLIYAVSIAALMALSVFLLVVLYNIRINHYKFIYGIYMSFGADFKKLFETAFWEMWIVATVTFLPATGVSVLISYIILNGAGLPFSCPVWMLALTAVYGLIILLFSVWFPMKLMAIKTPMSLIVSQDNSNLVSSPRRSLKLYGTKFPFHYEFFSTWRFRKYNLRLLVSAVIFTSLFISGLYIAEITRVTLSHEKPQFEIDLSNTYSEYDDLMRQELYAIDGITLVSKSNTETATNISTHIRVKSEHTVAFSNLVVPENADGYRVTNEVQFRTIDEDIVAELEKYEYTGDLSCILKDENTVIVADSINNLKKFDYEVGDTIEIATISKRYRNPDTNMTGINLLKQQLDCFEFEYHEYTIGAIIYDIPTLKMPIYMSDKTFETVTDLEVSYKNLEVYVDQTLTAPEVLEIETELRNWGIMLGDTLITNTHNLHMSIVNEDKQYDEIFTLVASLLLCISPMIWFFSQTLYYFKRENEFTILQSIGALGSDIRKLYICGGIFMSILSLIFCIGLGYLLSFGLFRFVNVTIPQWTLSYIRYEFYMPWYAIVLSIVVSVMCGFLSSYLPYHSFMKRKAKTLSVEYGEVSE